MRWLLVGYMFLFIDRPFEVWPILGDWHLERVYMIVSMLVWFVSPGKRWLANPFHVAVLGLASAIAACWVLSPWAEATQPRVEDWFKILVFYLMLVSCVNSERDLKFLITGFVAVMGLYLLHSFREYLGGRHTYRMGIARMIGVDRSLGDPNSFAASIVVALPIAWSLWRFARPWMKVALLGYAGLSVLCVLLTGSRSGFLVLAIWLSGLVLMSRHRWLAIAAAVIIAPIAFFALPDSLQNRFETIINPDVGPANAKESGEGRIEGLIKGFELWNQYPLTGVGPGAWRPATKSSIESHSLIGQLVGEMGLLGVVSFGAILAMYGWNLWRIRKNPDDEIAVIARQIGIAIGLLLLLGVFGHNLFRFTWLWYGGFLVIAKFVIDTRVPVDEPESLIFEERINAVDVDVVSYVPLKMPYGLPVR